MEPDLAAALVKMAKAKVFLEKAQQACVEALVAVDTEVGPWKILAVDTSATLVGLAVDMLLETDRALRHD